MKLQNIHIDFETYSECDLKKQGAWNYSQHPSTVVLCTSIAIGDNPSAIFYDEQEVKSLLTNLLSKPDTQFYAWNSFFECCIINNVLGIPITDFNKWNDVMAWASASALPQSLGECSKVFFPKDQDKQKDKEGKSLIARLCMPQKMSWLQLSRAELWKAEHPNATKIIEEALELKKQAAKIKDPAEKVSAVDRYTYMVRDYTDTKVHPKYKHEDYDEILEALGKYCMQDTDVERRLSEFIRPLSETEKAVWVQDQIINWRGVRCDVHFCNNAIKIFENSKDEKLQEIKWETGLDNPNSTIQLSKWLNQYIEVDNLQSATIRELLLDKSIPKNVRDVLALRSSSARTPPKKYTSMVLRADPNDNRIRGTLAYHAASCVDSETEVLTQSGWAKIKDWQKSTPIAISDECQNISFATCDKYVSEREVSDWMFADTLNINMLVTYGHNIGFRVSGKGHNTPLEYVSATDLFDNKSRVQIPCSGDFTFGEKYTPEQAKFFAMLQADGRVSEFGSFSFSFKKQRKVERCKEILSSLGIKFSHKKHSNHTDYIRVNKGYLPIWYCAEMKYFSSRLLDMSEEAVEAFINELSLWDGDIDKRNGSATYNTTVRSNAEWVQTICSLSGRQSVVRVKKTRKGWSDCYRVCVSNKRKDTRLNKHQYGNVEYTGLAYCPITPTGFWLARREGKIFITRNTGRWASRGINVQNLPRPSLKDFAAPVQLILDDNELLLELSHGDKIETLCSLIRCALIPSDGNTLVVSDYSSIEARVLAWLAGEEGVLEVFRTHGKVYEYAASKIYKLPMDKINKDQRFVGKTSVLACGYQGGKAAFQRMAEAYGVEIPEDKAERIVKEWRKSNQGIVKLWYETQRKAIAAMLNKGKVMKVNKYIAFKFVHYNAKPYLLCRLPSGRFLTYVHPKLKEGKFGNQLTYMGIDSFTRQWKRIDTYGGKLCIGEDTPVLTEDGWKPIQYITSNDVLWDGEHWVNCGGSVYKGKMFAQEYKGVIMTPDHKILTTRGWVSASQSKRYNRVQSRLPKSNQLLWERWQEIPMDSRVRLQKAYSFGSNRIEKIKRSWSKSILRVQEKANSIRKENRTWYEQTSCVLGMEVYERQMYPFSTTGLQKLWSERDRGMPRMAEKFREFLGRHGGFLSERFNTRQNKQRRELHQRELPLGRYGDTSKQQAQILESVRTKCERVFRKIRYSKIYNTLSHKSRVFRRTDESKTQSFKQLYDIMNCGDNNRFVVRDKFGNPLIVHNCENITQAVARDVLANAKLNVIGTDYDNVVLSVHDELICDVPKDVANADKLSELMCDIPDWAEGLPVSSEGEVTERYWK